MRTGVGMGSDWASPLVPSPSLPKDTEKPGQGSPKVKALWPVSWVVPGHFVTPTGQACP